MKNIMKYGMILLLIFSFSHSQANQLIGPNTEKECVALGGNWTVLGLPIEGKSAVCDLKTSDAGKSCSDSKDCEGSCFAPKNSKVGNTSKGTCSDYRLNYGNQLLIENGNVISISAE